MVSPSATQVAATVSIPSFQLCSVSFAIASVFVSPQPSTVQVYVVSPSATHVAATVSMPSFQLCSVSFAIASVFVAPQPSTVQV